MSQSWISEAWFNALPSVDIDTLDNDDKNCGICRLEYSSSPSASEQQEDTAEDPVRLPCGHVFGKQCLKTWLNPGAANGNDTCPTCRHQLSGHDPALEENIQHLRWLQRLDYANDADRRTVVGELISSLSEPEARFEFHWRVDREMQKQSEILEMRREIRRTQRNQEELRLRAQQERRVLMALRRADELLGQQSDQQELEQENERLLQLVEQQQLEMDRKAEELDRMLRERSAARRARFLRRGGLAHANDTAGQEHQEH